MCVYMYHSVNYSVLLINVALLSAGKQWSRGYWSSGWYIKLLYVEKQSMVDKSMVKSGISVPRYACGKNR